MNEITHIESLKRLERAINQDFTYDIFVEEIKSKGDNYYAIHINSSPIFMGDYLHCYKLLCVLCESEQI